MLTEYSIRVSKYDRVEYEGVPYDIVSPLLQAFTLNSL